MMIKMMFDITSPLLMNRLRWFCFSLERGYLEGGPIKIYWGSDKDLRIYEQISSSEYSKSLTFRFLPVESDLKLARWGLIDGPPRPAFSWLVTKILSGLRLRVAIWRISSLWLVWSCGIFSDNRKNHKKIQNKIKNLYKKKLKKVKNYFQCFWRFDSISFAENIYR